MKTGCWQVSIVALEDLAGIRNPQDVVPIYPFLILKHATDNSDPNLNIPRGSVQCKQWVRRAKERTQGITIDVLNTSFNIEFENHS